MLAVKRFRASHGPVAFVGEGRSDRPRGALRGRRVRQALARPDARPTACRSSVETFDDVVRALETLEHLPGAVAPCFLSRMDPPPPPPRRPDPRPATREDVAAMPRAHRRVQARPGRGGRGRSRRRRDVVQAGRVRPARDCLLVHDGDELVGWAEVHKHQAEADVRPSHRGRGIGSRAPGVDGGPGGRDRRARGHADGDRREPGGRRALPRPRLRARRDGVAPADPVRGRRLRHRRRRRASAIARTARVKTTRPPTGSSRTPSTSGGSEHVRRSRSGARCG